MNFFPVLLNSREQDKGLELDSNAFVKRKEAGIEPFTYLNKLSGSVKTACLTPYAICIRVIDKHQHKQYWAGVGEAWLFMAEYGERMWVLLRTNALGNEIILPANEWFRRQAGHKQYNLRNYYFLRKHCNHK